MEETGIIKKDNFSSQLTVMLNEVHKAIPQGFNITRFALNCAEVLNESDGLKEFINKNPTGLAQIKQGMLKAAYLGLDFAQKEVYLIPFGKSLNFMVDYRGNVKLCKKYSTRKIKDIYAKLVREGDVFEEKIIDGKPSIDFKPLPFNNSRILGAFAVVLYEDGGMDYDTMSLDDLENTRRHSKASNSPAWKDFTGQMYLKTVLHRLCKHIDISFDNIEQINAFNEDMEIETDTKKRVENEIAEKANQTEFIDEDVVDVEEVFPTDE